LHVHKQDTARLNSAELAGRIRELGLKQYLLARTIGVEPLTVNRWLTGKVKRISRDNLARLAAALSCTEDALSFADEADVRATQQEQTSAARMLLEARAKTMFAVSGDYELYESLLKAVMHPNMPVSELCEIYNTLTKTSVRQCKYEDAREYNRLTLEYAQRSGNVDREFSALSNKAAIEGECGMLARARLALEDVISFAESVGNTRGRAIAGINLMHVYWLEADWHKAIKIANASIPLLRELAEPVVLHHGLANAAWVARETGQYKLALKIKHYADSLEMVLTPGTEAHFQSVRALLVSLEGDPARGLELLEEVYAEVRQIGRIVEDNCVTSATVLRRAGELERAQEHVDAMLAADWLGKYDHPFLHAEAARIAAARRDGRGARRLRQLANAEFVERGMDRWASDDPAVEVGAQFPAPVRLKLKVI
jgi:transcriptional regulator with XRE-family HTH domain